jgi:hypothetical protein
MLTDDPAMQVVQIPDGTIRMIESGVPTDLLNVRIGHISFEVGPRAPSTLHMMLSVQFPK